MITPQKYWGDDCECCFLEGGTVVELCEAGKYSNQHAIKAAFEAGRISGSAAAARVEGRRHDALKLALSQLQQAYPLPTKEDIISLAEVFARYLESGVTGE